MDTVEANHALGHATDLRQYEVAIKMLRDMGIAKVRLLTNSPTKVRYLEQHGVEVIRVPLLVKVNTYSERYQKSKAVKLGHHIPLCD